VTIATCDLRHALFEGLPPAAWCLTISHSSRDVRLVHGAAVEVNGGTFFEGVWDGPWGETPGPQHAFFGTGGIVHADTLEILTSNFKVHGVFMIDTEEHLFVANTLPLLLVQSGRALIPDYQYVRHYQAAVSLSWRGITSGLHAIPVNAGTVKFYARCRLKLHRSATGGIDGTEVVKNFGPRFDQDVSFHGYRDAMEGALRRILANASATGRGAPYGEAIVAMSAGYDSAGVAVLASRAGCALGATIDDGSGDSGEPIGKELGLQMHVAPLSTSRNSDDIATVMCMPGNRLHVPWLALRPHLRRRLVLTGWHGDTNWSLNPASPYPEEFASWIGLGGLPEARLWMDAAFVALPAIGDGDQHHLVGLSRSEAMSPFRSGNGYDRPIPRRLAVEAGVDALLADTKMGSSAHYFNPARPELRAELRELRDRVTIAPLPSEYVEVEQREFAAAGWTARFASETWRHEPFVTELEVWFRWALAHLMQIYAARLEVPGTASVPALTVV
jgi:hypothetical protein